MTEKLNNIKDLVVSIKKKKNKNYLQNIMEILKNNKSLTANLKFIFKNNVFYRQIFFIIILNSMLGIMYNI